MVFLGAQEAHGRKVLQFPGSDLGFPAELREACSQEPPDPVEILAIVRKKRVLRVVGPGGGSPFPERSHLRRNVGLGPRGLGATTLETGVVLPSLSPSLTRCNGELYCVTALHVLIQ